MSEFEFSAYVEEARRMVQQRLFDDISDAMSNEDLRDYGLDSIRLIALLGTLRERGVSIDFAEITGAPTLELLATAIASSAQGERAAGSGGSQS